MTAQQSPSTAANARRTIVIWADLDGEQLAAAEAIIRVLDAAFGAAGGVVESVDVTGRIDRELAYAMVASRGAEADPRGWKEYEREIAGLKAARQAMEGAVAAASAA